MPRERKEQPGAQKVHDGGASPSDPPDPTVAGRFFTSVRAPARSETGRNLPDLARRETKASVIAALATGTADLVATARDMCSAFIDRLRSDAEIIVSTTPRKPLPKWIRLVTREMVVGCLAAGRKLRIFDRVPIHKLPSLVDDRDEDHRLKADIVDDLDSRVGVYLPFVDELEHIARNCFDRGILAEKLIAFLESDEILTMLVHEVLNLHHSRYRSSSVMSILSSGFDSAVQKLRDVAAKYGKAPVEGDAENRIKKHIEYFKDHYDPRDIRYTVANFVKELREAYPEYDVLLWLDKNKQFLIEILKGDQSHIANIIRGAYERRGRENPQQFVALNIPEFLECSGETDIAFIKRQFVESGVPSDSAFFELDLESLHYFFEEIIPRIQSHDLGPAHLQKMIIDQCEQFILTTNPRVTALVIRQDSHYDVHNYSNNVELRQAVEDIIKANTHIISSHVDVVNLLADPEEISPEIRQNYIDWFDGARNLRRGTYYEYLRRIFGHSTKEAESVEDFDKVKRRVARILRDVNSYLDSLGSDLGLPSIIISERVKETNDYAELVKIANEADTKEEHFAARRKIELAMLVYSCLQTPRMVYRDRDTEEIKKTLQSRKGPLHVSEDLPLREVKFVDAKDGKPHLVLEPSAEDSSPVSTDDSVKSFQLIPAKFAGIDCYLLPTRDSEDEEPASEREYLGKKTLRSMMTKLLHRDQMRAKDVTDLIRMTFVVDSTDKLLQLQEYLETNYISFGRTLRRENRYGDFVKIASFSVGASVAKSDEYRALRYVVDVPVWDQTGEHTYFAPLEIRILLLEDCMREKSTNHPASHRLYEERRLRTISEKIAPQTIHPELYKTVGPDQFDIFKKQKIVLKSKEDFAAAA